MRQAHGHFYIITTLAKFTELVILPSHSEAEWGRMFILLEGLNKEDEGLDPTKEKMRRLVSNCWELA